jgi:RNA polymerase sigma-70 factor (ECF subfamily)
MHRVFSSCYTKIVLGISHFLTVFAVISMTDGRNNFLTMVETQSDTVTKLLGAWKEGDKRALDQLVPIVYAELHQLAKRYLSRERASHTLQPTALIHEAYVRLLGQSMPDWKGRTHFFAVAAQLMRQVLVDYARKHRSRKRGGGQEKISLDQAVILSLKHTDLLLTLDQALIQLETFDKRKCRAIELRYFAGFSVEETAEALNISVATVRRDIRMAEAWLYQEMAK